MLKITQVLMPWQNNKPNPTCTVTKAAKPGIPLENVGKVSSVLPVMDNFLPRVTIKRRNMLQSGVCTGQRINRSGDFGSFPSGVARREKLELALGCLQMSVR